MRVSELPRRFQEMYKRRFCWTGEVRLIALGPVKKSENPYYAITEKNVENRIVRWFGKWPTSNHSILNVEREDGAVWMIYLDYFEIWQRIDYVDPEITFIRGDEIEMEAK